MPTDKRERQRQNREAARELQDRIDRRKRLLRGARTAALVAVLVLGVGFLLNRGNDSGSETASAIGGTDTTIAAVDGTDPAPSTTTTDTTQVPPTSALPESLPAGAISSPAYLNFRSLPVACGGTRPPAATEMSFEAAGDEGLDPAATVRATIVTSCGDIVVDLDVAGAPQTVNSFVFLARQDYFDGTVSHRIVPGFVFQAGDPTATGSGGPGYQFADELPAADFSYVRGTLAMANSGPDTNGSQFFIVFENSTLGPDFSVFGNVAEGLDVLDTIAAIAIEGQTPLVAVYIEDIIIEVG